MLILVFLAYTAFCFWVIFLDGADQLEGWKSLVIFDWFAASLTPRELKFYVGISWLAGIALLAFSIFA